MAGAQYFYPNIGEVYNVVKAAGIIFDGDDTLWETMPAYTSAKHQFFKEMAVLGFHEQQIQMHFERTDVANVDKLGFSPDRFSNSMIETYHYFCEMNQVKATKSIEERIRDLGNGVVSIVPKVHSQAHEILDQLQVYFRLFLVTKGDVEVQAMKVRESALGLYFDRVYIFDQKTERELNLVIEDNDLPRKDSWAIGNSLRSDINPALRVGLKAIWIPQYTWDYEEAPYQDTSGLFTIESLEDCLPILIPSCDSRRVAG